MTKEDFANYRMLDYEVRKLRTSLAAMESVIYAPRGQRYSSTPKAASGPKRTMDDVVASHAALRDKYEKKLLEKSNKLLAVEDAIESLTDPAERLIMRFRYIDGHSWREVCSLMRRHGVSERQVYRMHGWALAKLKEA